MTANGSATQSLSAVGLRPPRYCTHNAAREIRMYMAYGEANAIRLRLSLSAQSRWRHVSTMYEIPGGWAWTLCNECPAEDRRPAVGE